jgi:hypothetical protein
MVICGIEIKIKKGMKMTKKKTQNFKKWGMILGLLTPALSVTGEGLRTVSFEGFSRAPAVDVSASYAYPVPFKPSLGQRSINFINLPSDVTVRIFSMDGDLVRVLHDFRGDGILKWDVTDESGKPLKSDVFFYTIESAEQIKSGRLLVVR